MEVGFVGILDGKSSRFLLYTIFGSSFGLSVHLRRVRKERKYGEGKD